MTLIASECFMLTPAGVLHAFARKTPDDTAAALQSLLTGEHSLSLAAWTAVEPAAPDLLAGALENGWDGAIRYVSFHSDPEFFLPDHAFLPFCFSEWTVRVTG